MSVYTTRINVSIPSAFLKAVDDAAKASYVSRSDFIRLALMEKMGWKNLIHGPGNKQKVAKTAEPTGETDEDVMIEKLLANL